MGESDRLSDVARAVDELTRRGFPEEFRIVDGTLQVVRTGQRLRSEDLVIRAHYRFEGISDPDDMSIVYGIESTSGPRGVLVDAFGVYADPAVSAVLQDVPMRETQGHISGHRDGGVVDSGSVTGWKS